MRILKYAIKNIKRNAFLSLSSILVISLIIFFINVLILLNYTTDILISRIVWRLTFSVVLDKWYTSENSDVVELISSLRSVGKNMEVNYVSPEEALFEMWKNNPDLIKIIESESENPLPAHIKISWSNIDQYDTINWIIKQYQNVLLYDEKSLKSKIVDFKTQYESVKSVTGVLYSVKIWIYFIIFFFIFSVFVIIYNIIWNFIFFYRDEIKITKLVWWDDIFIYGPFSIQWLLYTIISTGFSFLFFFYLVLTLDKYLIDFPLFISGFIDSNTRYFLYEIAWVSVIGMLSWFLSSKKFISKSIKTEKILK